MASYSYIPPAYLCIFQELQHRFRQPFVLEKIYNLQPRPALTPPLPALSLLPRKPLNPLFEGKALSLPRAASSKQVPTRLFSSRVAPPTGVRLFLFYPHKVGPNEGVTRRQLEKDRSLAMFFFSVDLLVCHSASE
jgi:hypothetical protein